MPLIEPNNIPRLWTRWFAKADRKIKGLKSRLYENGCDIIAELKRRTNTNYPEDKAPHGKELDFPRDDREFCLLKY
jgi:hypothetical protein